MAHCVHRSKVEQTKNTSSTWWCEKKIQNSRTKFLIFFLEKNVQPLYLLQQWVEDGQRGRNGQIAVPIVVKVSKEEIENVTIPFQDGVDQYVKKIMWKELNALLLVQVHT